MKQSVGTQRFIIETVGLGELWDGLFKYDPGAGVEGGKVPRWMTRDSNRRGNNGARCWSKALNI